MQITLAGVGILSLFLIMLVPVYAEVIEISVEKSFYTIDEKISFSGNNEEGNAMISVVVKDPNGKRNYVIGTISNSEGKFETAPVSAKNIFSTIGIYEFTAFTLKEENGSSISLKFDGDRILEEEKPLLQLNLIEDKIIEVENTISFTVSITDNTFIETYDGRDPFFSLENAPVDATIDASTGKFLWTPSKSYGSFEDVTYNFDIVVKADNQEDRENISIIIKKAYDEPTVEPTVEPTKSTIASFVDQSKDPQTYVDRYNNEESYKEWFDTNYSQYSSIYQAVGLEEPEFGICGEGTKLIDGICSVIEKISEKPWWQFW